jgi:hypothetical protein
MNTKIALMKVKITLLTATLVMLIITTPALANKWDTLAIPGNGKLVGGPSAVLWFDGKSISISIFVRGTDDALWWNTAPSAPTNVWGHQIFNWGGWKKIGGGTISSSPSCVATINSRINCYARGKDNALWFVSYQDVNIGQWGQWRSLGGGLNGAPSATSWRLGHDVVFARGSLDNALYQIETGDSQGWSGVRQWSSNGGSTVTDPGCAALAYDDFVPIKITTSTDDASVSTIFMRRVACYSMGTPEQMFQYTSFWNPSSLSDLLKSENAPQPLDTTKTWTQVDGQTAYAPSLIYADANSHDVYVTRVAPNNTLWHRAWRLNSGWGKWEDTGGTKLISGPSCIRLGSIKAAQTMCFAQAADGSVTMRWNH